MASAAASEKKSPGPGVLRSYLELCRASNLPTVWTNVLCATLLSGADWYRLATLASALSLTLTYLGGMALNDILDLDEDRVRKPGRPLPSGRISMAGAWTFALALFAGGLILLLVFCNPLAIASGVALIVTIYLYDRLHRLSPATVLLMAACRALVFVTTALAVSGTVPLLALVGAAVQFTYIVGLTAVARWEKSANPSFKIPPIPWMLAAISLVDGALIAGLAGRPAWLPGLILGLGGAILTRLAQTQVRGD